MEFLRHRGAAHDGASLEHFHPVARGGEIEGADEAVMARPDDDDIASLGHAHPPARNISSGSNCTNAGGRQVRLARWASSKQKPPRVWRGGCCVVVAGTGFEPVTFRL